MSVVTKIQYTVKHYWLNPHNNTSEICTNKSDAVAECKKMSSDAENISGEVLNETANINDIMQKKYSMCVFNKAKENEPTFYYCDNVANLKKVNISYRNTASIFLRRASQNDLMVWDKDEKGNWSRV